ncbi:UNVERIFIED_CONTAM: hypothetical protein K2H54_003383 [Gekko kuhli]
MEEGQDLENLEISQLTVEQFKKLFQDEFRSAFKEACKNLWEKPQNLFVDCDGEKEESQSQPHQYTVEDENRRQSTTVQETLAPSKIGYEKFSVQTPYLEEPLDEYQSVFNEIYETLTPCKIGLENVRVQKLHSEEPLGNFAMLEVNGKNAWECSPNKKTKLVKAKSKPGIRKSKKHERNIKMSKNTGQNSFFPCLKYRRKRMESEAHVFKERRHLCMVVKKKRMQKIKKRLVYYKVAQYKLRVKDVF